MDNVACDLGQARYELEAELQIYVACLAAYSNGKLHGRWIDAAQSPDEILGEIGAMLAESPEPNAEEWAIHDHAGWGEVYIHEMESIENVSILAGLMSEHGSVVGTCQQL